MVSLCLQPEITLAVFSSNHNKNRERLFQTKRQKTGLWWSFILWDNEQMWDLWYDHPMSTSAKGPGRTPAERGQGICCMWPRSERPVNVFWVCSDEGSWLRSPVTHFEDKVGKCHHGIICDKKSTWCPHLETSRIETKSGFGMQRPQVIQRYFLGLSEHLGARSQSTSPWHVTMTHCKGWYELHPLPYAFQIDDPQVHLCSWLIGGH